MRVGFKFVVRCCNSVSDLLHDFCSCCLSGDIVKD
jgi:hypothetical protein